LPRLILDYRGLAKLRSTYTDKLSGIVNPRTGRVHTSYHQGAVATGRISSSDPNLQNIPCAPRKVGASARRSSRPPGWKVMAADYSQIELRIMAHLSGDEGLLRAFQEGGDVHRATAAEVFGVTPEDVTTNQRRAAKAINFGLMYGMSAFGLARQLGVDRGEASDYMARYFSRYPGVRALWKHARAGASRWLRRNHLRPPPVSGKPHLAQSGPAPGRRARRGQRADAGQRRRHHQARDDPWPHG
jgi:DNA polymerase-1